MYRVALVCEGPTDRVILEAILDTYLDDYVPLAIQPPSSATGRLGNGWKGVRAWCAQEASVGADGPLGVLPHNADLIVVQVDADVAKEHDSDIVLDDGVGCPPPSVLTDPVRAALLAWLGVSRPPGGLVLCVPAMATETWALVALYPESIASARCIECETSIKGQLRKRASKREPKLVTLQDGKPKNNANGYRAARREIAEGWPMVVENVQRSCAFRPGAQVLAGHPNPTPQEVVLEEHGVGRPRWSSQPYAEAIPQATATPPASRWPPAVRPRLASRPSPLDRLVERSPRLQTPKRVDPADSRSSVEHTKQSHVRVPSSVRSDSLVVLVGIEDGAHPDGLAIGKQQGERNFSRTPLVGAHRALECLDGPDEPLLA